MSRSRKKTPVAGVMPTKSEKRDKQSLNRTLRRKLRIPQKLAEDCLEDIKAGELTTVVDNIPPLKKNEIMSTWEMGKDGKRYYSKNDTEYKKVMKK
jgi:hypothetical protein